MNDACFACEFCRESDQRIALRQQRKKGERTTRDEFAIKRCRQYFNKELHQAATDHAGDQTGSAAKHPGHGQCLCGCSIRSDQNNRNKHNQPDQDSCDQKRNKRDFRNASFLFSTYFTHRNVQLHQHGLTALLCTHLQSDSQHGLFWFPAIHTLIRKFQHGRILLIPDRDIDRYHYKLPRMFFKVTINAPSCSGSTVRGSNKILSLTVRAMIGGVLLRSVFIKRSTDSTSSDKR